MSSYQKIKLAKLNQLIQESFCGELMQDALTRLIAKRYKELEDELKD